jgi:hypothetical protein
MKMTSESGKIRIRVFWLTSIVLSVVLSIVGTIILNLVLNS